MWWVFWPSLIINATRLSFICINQNRKRHHPGPRHLAVKYIITDDLLSLLFSSSRSRRTESGTLASGWWWLGKPIYNISTYTHGTMSQCIYANMQLYHVTSCTRTYIGRKTKRALCIIIIYIYTYINTKHDCHAACSLLLHIPICSDTLFTLSTNIIHIDRP